MGESAGVVVATMVPASPLVPCGGFTRYSRRAVSVYDETTGVGDCEGTMKYIAIENGIFADRYEERGTPTCDTPRYYRVIWVNGTYTESANDMAKRVAILMNADEVCKRLTRTT